MNKLTLEQLHLLLSLAIEQKKSDPDYDGETRARDIGTNYPEGDYFRNDYGALLKWDLVKPFVYKDESYYIDVTNNNKKVRMNPMLQENTVTEFGLTHINSLLG